MDSTQGHGTPVPGPTAPPPWTRADAVALVTVLGISAALVWPEMFRGWFPWDDGAMAQVAERVLHGQLPHRDFDDPWTGGWSFMQAGIFRQFGTSLRMLRIPIFVVWMASLACGFRLVRRFTTVGVAGVVTLAWAVWSLFAFHYPLLNWYFAPIALFAVWGVTRFVETGRRSYLVLAGVMVGVAIVFKISGLYLLAALLLWSTSHVSRLSHPTRQDAGDKGGAGFAVIVAVGGAALVCLVARLVSKAFPGETYGSSVFLFVMPVAAIVLWLSWSSFDAHLSVGRGLRALMELMVPLWVGVAVPLAPFLLWYAANGALGDLCYGVLVRPAARLSIPWFVILPGRVASAGMMLAPLVLGLGVRYAVPARYRVDAVVAVILGVGAGMLAQRDEFTASSTSLMVRGLPVLMPVLALWGSRRREEESGPYGSVVFLLVTCAVLSQLLQVPAPFLNYVIYVTPITVLAFVALLAHRRTVVSRPAILFAGIFLIVAGYSHPRIGPPDEAGLDRWARLALPRGGLWVSPKDSVMFQRIAMLVAQHPAGPIYVVGNAPVYSFLLERPSASRVIYDMLADSTSKDARLVLPMLKLAGVQVVIIRYSVYDDSLITKQKRALRLEFPENRQFGPLVFDGRTFSHFVEVRWRADSASDGRVRISLPRH